MTSGFEGVGFAGEPFVGQPAVLAPPPPPNTLQSFSLSIEVAFGDWVWATSPTWTDIANYVNEFTTTLERKHKLQQVNPSTATITLTNEPVSVADPGGAVLALERAEPVLQLGPRPLAGSPGSHHRDHPRERFGEPITRYPAGRYGPG